MKTIAKIVDVSPGYKTSGGFGSSERNVPGTGTDEAGLFYRHLTNAPNDRREAYETIVRNFVGSEEFGICDTAYFRNTRTEEVQVSPGSFGLFVRNHDPLSLAGMWAQFDKLERELKVQRMDRFLGAE